MALDIAITPVEGSSRVAGVGYDAASQTLAVQFTGHNGTVAHYYGVPPEVHADFVKADSLGRFLGSSIVGKYEFKTNPNKPADEET